MKRITTILTFLMLLCMGASAASTYFVGGRSSSITTGKKYMIYNTARRWFISASGSAYAVTSSTTPLAYSTTNANYIWTLEDGSASGTYKIKNLGTSTYCAGTSLGSAVDYTIAEFSTCPNKGGMASYNDNGTTKAAADITSADKAVYFQNVSTSGYFHGSDNSFNEYTAAHVYVLYEVIELEDGGLYTIDFVSFDKTKTWGLSTSGTSASISANATGSTFAAHKYKNESGEEKWIFVNNTDGNYLAYRAATATFNISKPINEFTVGALHNGLAYVDNSVDCTGLLYITAPNRSISDTSEGCYVAKAATNGFDASSAPFYNANFTSALRFTRVAGAPSSSAALAIAKFDALYEVKNYLTYAANISALFDSPTGIETSINAAVSADAAATVATNFMKSPEGKKFYAVNSTATEQYMNIGTSQITATATRLYPEAVMEVEYAGEGKYYLKGVKSGYYAGNPSSGSANPGTVSSKASATPMYIGNYANSVDNVVYFAKSKASTTEAIHYNSAYTDQGRVVAWTYDAGASQWNITYITDEYYETIKNLCDVTYNVIVAASGEVKASTNETPSSEAVGTALSVPTDLKRDFCTYTFYSDATCETEITTVPNAATATVYALASMEAPFEGSPNYAGATWYNLKLHGTYPSYANATPNVTLPTEPSSTENNVEWAFIGNPYDGYQIINKAAGDGKVLGAANGAASDGNNGGNTYATFATAGTQTNERWFPKPSTYATNGFYLFDEEGYALNKRSNDNLAFWTGGNDTGSTFEAFAVTDNSAELTEIASRLGAQSFGSGYGEYSLSGDYAGYESMMTTIISSFSSYSYVKLLNARGIDAAKSLNVPQAGDFLRIKASATNKSAYSVSEDIYLTSSNTQSDVNSSTYKNNRVGFALGEATDNTTIFYYDGSYLTGFANGLQPSNNSNQLKIGAVGATATSIAFESIESTENKAFRIEFNNHGRSLYTQRYNGVYFTDAAGGDATDAHYRYFLEKVTELPITVNQVGDKYYATLYMPVPVSITNSTAYTLQLTADNKWLTPTEVDGNVPAEQPVLLVGTSNEVTATVKSTAGSKVDTPLEGTLAAKAVEAETDYFLGRYSESGEEEDYEVGFFKWTETTLKGFRAYLPATKVAASRGFAIKWSDDDVTGIRAINNGKQAQNNGVYYDLSGRRVENPQHGMYIVNGRVVVIK